MKSSSTIKNRIKQLREARNLSVRALAKKARTSPATITNLENGKIELTVSWIIKLAKALNVFADEIVELPFSKKFAAACEEGLLGDSICYLLEACGKFGVKLKPKELSKWASYVYNETAKRHLPGKEVKALAYTVVRVIGQERG